MSAEQNAAVARNFIDTLWNKKDFSIVDRMVAADHVFHGPFDDQFPQGQEGQKAFASAFISAFPDVHCTIEVQDADEEYVKMLVTYTGTQTGQLMDIPATGRQATVPVVITGRIAGGKLAESWIEWDPNDMLRQLGVG